MLRDDRYKYVHHVGLPSQLFDLLKDPDETYDLAADPAHRTVLEACERELHAMVDPEELDRRSKEHQRRLLDAHGGEEAIRAGGFKFTHSPPPAEFADDPALAIRG
jgi:choline-sulfatase